MAMPLSFFNNRTVSFLSPFVLPPPRLLTAQPPPPTIREGLGVGGPAVRFRDEGCLVVAFGASDIPQYLKNMKRMCID